MTTLARHNRQQNPAFLFYRLSGHADCGGIFRKEIAPDYPRELTLHTDSLVGQLSLAYTMLEANKRFAILNQKQSVVDFAGVRLFTFYVASRRQPRAQLLYKILREHDNSPTNAVRKQTPL
jgi:hypothetical protein